MILDYSLSKEERIILAAEEIFSKYGFERATLDQIIALADVGKGTLYKYYGNKEQLFYHLVEEKNKLFVEELKRVADVELGFEAALVNYFEAMIGFYRKNNALWQIICFEMSDAANGCVLKIVDGEYVVTSRYAGEITEAVRKKIVRYHDLLSAEYGILREVLEFGLQKGLLKQDVNLDVSCTHLFFGVTMCIFRYNDIAAVYSDREAAVVAVDRFLRGEGS